MLIGRLVPATMMSSSQYSPNVQHTSRISPVLESEEDFDGSDDYSPGDSYSNNANGEAYLVTDFYHQPIPLPGMASRQGSDSGPEYCTPFVNATHSPGTMRHVFTPATSSFQSGSKQKPRMGIMATRSHSDKGSSKPVDSLRVFHPGNPDLSHSQQQQQQVSDEDLDSPVYDSTQYIVTPTRRRNSENDKSPNSRNFVRRDGSSRVEYPEVRGRPGESDELPAVPPGVVLLHPNMFKDGTLDFRVSAGATSSFLSFFFEDNDSCHA